MKTAKIINPKDRVEINYLLILPFNNTSRVVIGLNIANGSNTVL